MRASVLSSTFVTHSAPAPRAAANGLSVSIVATLRLSGGGAGWAMSVAIKAASASSVGAGRTAGGAGVLANALAVGALEGRLAMAGEAAGPGATGAPPHATSSTRTMPVVARNGNEVRRFIVVLAGLTEGLR